MSTDKKIRRGAAVAVSSPMKQDCLQTSVADYAEKQDREGLCYSVFPASRGTLASSRTHKRRGALLSYVVAIFVFVAMFSAFMTKRTMTDTYQVMLSRGTYKNQYYSRAIAELYRGALLSNHKYTGGKLAIQDLQSDAAITAANAEVNYKDTDFEVVPYLQCLRSLLEGRIVDPASTNTADLDIDFTNLSGIQRPQEDGRVKIDGYFEYLDRNGMNAFNNSSSNSSGKKNNNALPNQKYKDVTPGYYVAFMKGGGKRMRAWNFRNSGSARAQEVKAKYKLNPQEFTLFTGMYSDDDFTGDNHPLCFYAVTMGLWADYPTTNASRFLVNALTIRTNDTRGFTDTQYLQKVKTMIDRHSEEVAEIISYPTMNDTRLMDVLSQDPDYIALKPYLSFSLSTALVPIYESAMYQIRTYY